MLSLKNREEAGVSARHFPGLDALRGLAIVLVLIHHAFGPLASYQLAALPEWMRPVVWVIGFGYLGVHLFFTLSGFLITGILLDSRGRPDYYRHFYLRRLVRIGPAYVLTLLVLLVLGVISFKYLLLCLLFLANVPGIMGLSSQYGALWSLSVEEQFYLFWPFLVRRLSPHRLLVLALGVLLLSPLLRWGLQFAPYGLSDIRFKLWVVADFFAVGALGAVCVRARWGAPRISQIGLGFLLLGLLGVFKQFSATQWGTPLDKALQLSPFAVLFIGMLLLSYQYGGFARTWVGRVFCFLGGISYGLYLFHPLIFDLTSKYLGKVRFESVQVEVAVQMGLEISVAVALAYLSRRTFEAWFLALVPRSHEPAARLPDEAGPRLAGVRVPLYAAPHDHRPSP